MQLDFGGIAKGYAADECLVVLRSLGISRALVAASGDIAVGDPPPDKPHWRVEIGALPGTKEKRVLLLTNSAVSTSGDAEQFVEIAGVRYSHVVNPKTGLGLLGRRSVTVVARQGIFADSLTKMAMILPPEKALATIDVLFGTATLIVTNLDGKETTAKSKNFDGLLEVIPKKP
jgi:FAD:protein FMN transferase